jgi:hypothetical protein
MPAAQAEGNSQARLVEGKGERERGKKTTDGAKHNGTKREEPHKV